MQKKHSRLRRGFTLVELLAVLAIIVILVTITIPVVSRVRRSALAAATQAEISSIAASIERYHQTFNSYPGPLADGQLYNSTTLPTPSGLADANGPVNNVTGAENLVLGLMGGLKPRVPATIPPSFDFDRALVGNGPRSLNTANPKKYEPFIEGVPLTQCPDNPNAPGTPQYTAFSGKYRDGAGQADDSDIPEILDRFPQAMPILYLRARVGADGVVSIGGIPGTQYDINHILAYTRGGGTTGTGSIGEGKTIRKSEYTTPPASSDLPHGLQSVDENRTLTKGAGYVYPYDAFPYFVNRAVPPSNPSAPNATGTPKQKDGFILISAGADRVYGTADDIASFGSVNE